MLLLMKLTQAACFAVLSHSWSHLPDRHWPLLSDEKKEKRGKVRKFHWILPNESGTTKEEKEEGVSQSEKIQMCKLMLLHLHWWHFSHHFFPFFLSFILFHLPCNSRQLWLVCRLLIHCFVDTHTNTHCSGSCCHTKKRKLGISALSRAHATLVHQHLTFFKAENEWERKRMKVDQWWWSHERKRTTLLHWRLQEECTAASFSF